MEKGYVVLLFSIFTEIWREYVSSKDSAQLGIIKLDILQLCYQVLNIVHVGAY